MYTPVIIIDDDPDILRSLKQTLELEDYECLSFESAEQALRQIKRTWPGVIISDINMPGLSGLEMMQRAHQIDADLPIILLTGHGDISMAIKAIRDGAYDFLEKPFSTSHLLEVLQRALEKRRLTLENRELKAELDAQSGPGPRILGSTPSIVRLRKILSHIKDTPADVLINGETGTGKELIARFLHDHSVRAKHPFVAINCGAIPETMIESELFGHEAGAFTGAQKKRIGKIAFANNGTLFLDEIESMPMALQIKLLRVLEERSVEPLGSNQATQLNLRVIAATKSDLKTLGEQGEFRSDLYYRLNVVEVQIPPLRERGEDIPLLLENFLRVAAARYQLNSPEISPQRLSELIHHDWPGNVRELRNLAERWVLMGEDAAFNEANNDQQSLNLAEQLFRFERTLLQDALQRHKGQLKVVQEELQIGRKTLYEKMKKYQLDKGDYKED
ncbi:sigma-54 dependent transcriptional regulator [Agarivorans sp. 1_MG-2023]|uniref:sigma-54-dependent transcriptional regulator n=1 Tax=Agarivorans sp. 1_MG-2023 TaxID=3062634 RepID=UPI0026E42983|nr:sigma-54 dependent transcriptional regulator [Agarivorans sp. 1_MG-2023]MDO6763582.1 sigma-54 dependent transcriptional regulator [Agarivorans sp. 1_MG-2023]